MTDQINSVESAALRGPSGDNGGEGRGGGGRLDAALRPNAATEVAFSPATEATDSTGPEGSGNGSPDRG